MSNLYLINDKNNLHLVVIPAFAGMTEGRAEMTALVYKT